MSFSAIHYHHASTTNFRTQQDRRHQNTITNTNTHTITNTNISINISINTNAFLKPRAIS
jgi:hypothetical protein